VRSLSPTAWIVLILFALFILSINFGLLASLRKKHKIHSPMEPIRKAAGTLRQPWRSEDEDLAELSKRVNELENPPGSKPPPPQI